MKSFHFFVPLKSKHLFEIFLTFLQDWNERQNTVVYKNVAVTAGFLWEAIFCIVPGENTLQQMRIVIFTSSFHFASDIFSDGTFPLASAQ